MDWRNAYPDSKGITRGKLWEAVQKSRAQAKFEELSSLLSNLSVKEAKDISTFSAPGISSLLSDDKGRIIASNCGFTLMSGYGFDDIKGKNCKMLQKKDDKRNALANALMRKAFRNQLPVVTILFNVTKQGHEFCTLIDIRPIFTQGRLHGFYSLQACIDKQIIPKRLPEPMASIVILGSDGDFFERVSRWAKPMCATVSIKAHSDYAFHATLIIIDNARIEVCRNLRDEGVTCPIFILTSIHQPLNQLCTTVTGVFNKEQLGPENIRHMLRVAGQHLPPAKMPPQKPIQILDEFHDIGKITDSVKKIITNQNEILALKQTQGQTFDIISRLVSPHIVSLEAITSHNDSLWEYFPMDAVEFVEEHGPPGLAWVEPIRQALVYLHKHGIIHRQIAAEHVLVSDQRVKLAGLNTLKYVDLGRTMTHVGIPEYVAPEVIMNKGYDKAADAWSLGVLMHYVQTGELPFTAEHPLELYSSMYNYNSPWPLINNLLKINPHDRLLINESIN